ncbi:hypothetical protein EO087_15895 [Dyella sp. M7H15-1]|nr:DUF6587 family protein [Dyella sp. M7H15-1]QAU25288.1 hypothetical protein EO087_15895 [Dyella sp. M7H15-1]
MNTSLLVQYIVMALIVLASALYALRKLAPQLTGRWLASVSIQFSQPGHAAWIRAWGRRLQPKQATGSCSDGCSTCGACGPKRSIGAKGDTVPLEFRQRNR